LTDWFFTKGHIIAGKPENGMQGRAGLRRPIASRPSGQILI
jgi:hypothetical protein